MKAIRISLRPGPVAGKYNILLYNDFFGTRRVIKQQAGLEGVNFFSNPAFLRRADAVVFHLPTFFRWSGQEKRKGQIWVAETAECDLNYPHQIDEEFMQRFDLKMSYHLNSDLPRTYLRGADTLKLQQAPGPKADDCMVCSFVSNSNLRWLGAVERKNYLRELSKHIRIDFYGSLMRNRTMERDEGIPSKMAVLSRYKFDLAFENIRSEDYVTEKYFQPLMAGTLPVYIGAPNIDRFAPGEKCHINADDFSGPKELAEYLLHLNANEAEYEAYFDWKKNPLRQSFQDIRALSPDGWPVQLAHRLKQMRNGI